MTRVLDYWAQYAAKLASKLATTNYLSSQVTSNCQIYTQQLLQFSAGSYIMVYANMTTAWAQIQPIYLQPVMHHPLVSQPATLALASQLKYVLGRLIAFQAEMQLVSNIIPQRVGGLELKQNGFLLMLVVATYISSNQGTIYGDFTI